MQRSMTSSESNNKKLRNQISAFQARLKHRITKMDQEVRLELKNQQIGAVLKIIARSVDK